MKRLALVLVTALPLAGCMTTQSEQIAADDARCLSYGVAKGSPTYIQCRLSLDQQRSDRQALQGAAQSGGLMGAIERSTQQ
jgi:hypothetical protein